MVDHYPEEEMPEPERSDKVPEYDTEQDPERCKVRHVWKNITKQN
jgi:hypothetical protein